MSHITFDLGTIKLEIPAEFLTASPTAQHVLDFAGKMEKKLAANRHKGDAEGWRATPPQILMERLRTELAELTYVVNAWNNGAPRPTAAEIANEAADVANFAMMIADQFAHAESMMQ